MNTYGNITKEDCVKILCDQGYDATIGDNGIVVIYVEMTQYIKGTKKYKQAVEATGYQGSWGCKPAELK